MKPDRKVELQTDLSDVMFDVSSGRWICGKRIEVRDGEQKVHATFEPGDEFTFDVSSGGWWIVAVESAR